MLVQGQSTTDFGRNSEQLIKEGEYMSKTVAQVETDAVKLDAQNIRKCEYYVRSMQRKL